MQVSPSLSKLRSLRAEWLVLAAIMTYAAHEIPWAIYLLTWSTLPDSVRSLGENNYWYILTLLFGLALTLPNRNRSGLRFGSIHLQRERTILVSLIPVLLALLIYPRLPVRPFSDSPAGIWLISPLAQDLVFIGYLYGRFEPLFPKYIGPRFRMRWALPVTALFFSAWHLPNFETIPSGFVLFQLFYTFAIFSVAGLSRQWTGSIIPFTLAHSAINFIAWAY